MNMEKPIIRKCKICGIEKMVKDTSPVWICKECKKEKQNEM